MRPQTPLPLLLLVAALLSACASTDSARQPPHHARYFKEVEAGLAERALACGGCQGLFTRLVEMDKDGRAKGDTLRAWVEHVPRPGLPLSKRAQEADLVVSCYPRGIQNPHLRERHVFPEAKGRIYFNYIGGGYIVATDRMVDTFRFVRSVQRARRNAYLSERQSH